MKPDRKTGVIVGIAGAAGDGLDKTGDTLARTASRLGLYVFAYNSYQSIIRGGHTWLRIRLAENKVTSQGDQLHALITLNQDSMERHAPEVEPGGVIFYNSDKIQCEPEMMGIAPDVSCFGLPVGELTKPFGRIKPVMQNSIMMGAMLYWLGLDFQVTESVISDTFTHKEQEVIDQNTGIARAGYLFAKENNLKQLDFTWNTSKIRRPFITGNEAIALGAAAGGLKFYAAYPMTPASTILHWLMAHSEKVGVMVKQVEDELAAINMAIGAGLGGVRSMCGTSGGGFALMTEAVGLAGMAEVPVVVVNAQRGGPSTGLPTKTEQGDLYQVLGASQGDYPRIILAPTTTTDAYYSAVEALNLAEEFQCPVIILSDLLLSEHPETIEAGALTPHVPIDRGKLLVGAPEGYKRYAMTPDGISPRVLPGTPGAAYIAASDEHDEDSNVISDQFTNPPLRRKMHEKRMRKMAGVLPKLKPPELEGPAGAETTLVGWGSTWGVIHEALGLLAGKGISANHLQIKYITPFHSNQVRRILAGSSRIIVVENNISGQFARYLRSQTGIQPAHLILKYDGEPFSPGYIVEHVEAILSGKTPSLQVTEKDAKEIAYHYIRIYLNDAGRPIDFKTASPDGFEEAVWEIAIANKESGARMGALLVGADTGATYSFTPAVLNE